jgi:hypothetical protein
MRLLLVLLLSTPLAQAQTADTSRVYRLAQLTPSDRIEERVAVQEVSEANHSMGWFQFESAYPMPLRSTDAGWLLRLQPGGATSYQVTYLNPAPGTDPERVADAAARIVRRHLPDDGPPLDVRRVYVVFRHEEAGRFLRERVIVR